MTVLQRKTVGAGLLSLALILGTWISPGPVAGGKYPAEIENLPPITIVKDGQARHLALTDVFEFYGNSCMSSSSAFLATSHGLRVLFGDEPADLADLVIVTPSAGGSIDFLDLLMRDDPRQRTWPPAGISGGADNFVFQFYRKSTMQGVIVKYKDGLWPADWFDLRAKQKAGTITDAERQRRVEARRLVQEVFPTMAPEDLFETSDVFTFVSWGHINPGELDRLGREQRRAARAQAAEQ
ncbi:hypothetical protein [Desulfonatronum sp. SC1]|uniref:hypothetical protein n=1 Tax=Desulfonatronum sp. SC1 TaxID=2109626 RepID=UPI000D2F5CA8|nr:hypothetical protein [Desulfonatronum sp. SC1]PTN32579.1 hypothetical protein C6366_16290 [Desulfonatronum sp. SC1]